MPRKGTTTQVKFCGPCDVVLSARRKRCDCGNEDLGATTQPASLECGHCGDMAIESPHGLFYEDQGEKCATCGFPGHVTVEENSAEWTLSDWGPDPAVCKRPDCDECHEVSDAA